MTTNYIAGAMVAAKPDPIAIIVYDDDASPFEWGDVIFDEWPERRWERNRVRDHITSHGPEYRRFLVSGDSHGPQSSRFLSYSWNAPHCGVIHIPSDFSDPRKAAQSWLEEYTSWCNGDVWGIRLVDAWTGDELDSCWGFIGLDYAKDAATNQFGPVSEVREQW